GEGIDAGNALAEPQQPYLVVAPDDIPVTGEQKGRIEGIVVRPIVHLGTDEGRYAQTAANHPHGLGCEVGAELARQGHGIATLAPHDELRAAFLQTTRLR